MQPNPENREALKSGSILMWLGFLLLVAGIGWFRWQYIDLRPVHTDEAENAYILAKDLAGHDYVFNPEHHHGPTLNLLLKIPAFLKGFHNYAEMEMRPLRAALWWLGILSVACFGFLRKYYGTAGLFSSALLAGTSAYLTYYGNYVIHETLLGLLALLIMVLMIRFVAKPSNAKATFIGVFAGLMFATKITSLIFFASVGFAAVVVSLLANREWLIQFEAQKWWKWILCLASAFVLTSTLVYTSFFQHPSAIWDAVSSLWEYQTESGHEKPWNYLLAHYILPVHQSPFGGYEWGLWGFALLGVLAPMIPKLRQSMHRPAIRVILFLSLSALFQLVVYSVISYKTPWLLLIIWIQVSVISGFGFSGLWKQKLRWLRVAALGLLLGAVFLQIRNTQVLNGIRHSDSRNPLAYAPTSANIELLPKFLEKQLQMASDGEPFTVGVYGAFTWPLPWYLRKFEHVDYEVRTSRQPLQSILILTDDAYETVDTDFLRNFRLYPYSLRPNFPVYVCIPKS